MSKTRAASKPLVRVESIAVGLGPGGRTSRARGRRVIGKILDPKKWKVVPFSNNGRVFEAVPKTSSRKAMDVATAWDQVYELQADPNVAWAEPLFEAPLDTQAKKPGCYDPDPLTDDLYEWSLDAMYVKDAWSLFTVERPGENIVVAHPDTGFTDHFEIVGSRLLDVDGYDFEDDDDDPHDPLAGGLLRNPGHGTSTASVIMSTEGPDAAAPAGDPFVSGVAPAVELIPIRATKGAAIFSTRNLIRAIDYAAAAPDIDIISISLGGPFKPQALRQAIIDATQKGIIVVCGAGNKFGFRLSVAYPAAFDEVIAVAASTYDEMPWPCSCRGPAVDISAPGWSVWCARTVKKKKKITYDVDRDSGTSFATAGIAGIAALWLSYHGRDTLVDKYGAAGVPAVFKQLLQESCQVPPAWPTDEFGPGIADARALLDLPLPEVAMMLTASGRKPISTGDDALETLVHLAYPAPRSGIAWTMARVMGVPETMLPAALHRVGGEISFKVATEMPLLRTLQAAAQAAIEPEAARKAGRTREQWVASVRRRLASDPASQQLRQSLATHGDGGQPKRNASRGGREITGRESTRSQRAK